MPRLRDICVSAACLCCGIVPQVLIPTHVWTWSRIKIFRFVVHPHPRCNSALQPSASLAASPVLQNPLFLGLLASFSLPQIKFFRFVVHVHLHHVHPHHNSACHPSAYLRGVTALRRHLCLGLLARFLFPPVFETSIWAANPPTPATTNCHKFRPS